MTTNTNTLAGNISPKANLGDMRGLAGGKFDGAKAQKDNGSVTCSFEDESRKQFAQVCNQIKDCVFKDSIKDTCENHHFRRQKIDDVNKIKNFIKKTIHTHISI